MLNVEKVKKPKGKSIRYNTRNSYIRPSDAISYTTLIVY